MSVYKAAMVQHFNGFIMYINVLDNSTVVVHVLYTYTYNVSTF